MRIGTLDEWDDATEDNLNRLVARPKPVLREEIKKNGNHRPHLKDEHFYNLERIALDSNILIIEGISGSGKDTFQTYLQENLKDRNVYTYSEGELLQSWKQLQIDGILELRIKFMKLFVTYVKDIVSRDEKALFLLNRFHLSTYASTIVKQPTLESEYNDIINVLRTLSVHVFILQLDEHEMEKRSSHPERAIAWQKHQKEIAKKEGFSDAVGRHIWQQRLIVDVAEKQRLPYSVLRLSSAPEIEGERIPPTGPQSIFRRGAQPNAPDAKTPLRKQMPSATVVGG